MAPLPKSNLWSRSTFLNGTRYIKLLEPQKKPDSCSSSYVSAGDADQCQSYASALLGDISKYSDRKKQNAGGSWGATCKYSLEGDFQSITRGRLATIHWIATFKKSLEGDLKIFTRGRLSSNHWRATCKCSLEGDFQIIT